MTFTNYQYYPTIPSAPNYPGDDQPLMQTNAANIASIFAQDHVGVNTPNGGIHTVVHFQTQTIEPPQTNPATGQIYTEIPVGDTDAQLFYKSPNNIVTQLTSDNQSDTLNGYVTLPGGIIIQWGTQAINAQGYTEITFTSPFPAECFNISLTLQNNQSNPSPNSAFVLQGSVNKNNFIIYYTGGSSTQLLYWQAIGN
jgi:hypothetical protein